MFRPLPTAAFALVLSMGVPHPSASQSVAESEHSITYEGESGPGLGRHVVLIAGDHEYRSEEILPAWGRILARRYGFKATVLFTLDDQGFIEPGSSNIRGLEVLDDADLMIVGLRFQDFPEEEMQHIVDYIDRGGPIIGIRTATHAFRIESGPHRRYSWDYEGSEYVKGFGRQVLGETWVSHYGTNHEQSSRVLPVPEAADHPVLRGVRDMHVQSGGYWVQPLDPFTTLALGEVLNGMDADSPADPEKERVPVVWTRTHTGANGRVGRVLTTTHGAGEDFLNDGFRRLLINASLWALRMENDIRPESDVSLVGPYHPVGFSFDGYRRGVRPSDMAGFDTPIMSPDKPTTGSGGNPPEGQPE